MQIAGTRDIADTTISVPHPLTESAAEIWIKRCISETASEAGIHLAISRPDAADSLIGYVGIKSIDREHLEGELSFWLDRNCAGHGYATEAASAAVDIAFSQIGLNRVCAYHMVRNQTSGHILAKLGFTQEGHLRQRVRKWGIYEDVLLWSRLSTDPTGGSGAR